MVPTNDLGPGCGAGESDLLADGAVATSARDAVMSSREAATAAAGGRAVRPWPPLRDTAGWLAEGRLLPAECVTSFLGAL